MWVIGYLGQRGSKEGVAIEGCACNEPDERKVTMDWWRKNRNESYDVFGYRAFFLVLPGRIEL